jgi:large subunit ribosomal protein L1
MPNPRTNTVVEAHDLPKAIRDSKQGRVEFRTDRTNLVHVPLGKVSFTEDALMENLASLIDAIVREKPSGAKGQYIRSLTLTTTMGPGIKLDIAATLSGTTASTV